LGKQNLKTWATKKRDCSIPYTVRLITCGLARHELKLYWAGAFTKFWSWFTGNGCCSHPGLFFGAQL